MKNKFKIIILLTLLLIVNTCASSIPDQIKSYSVNELLAHFKLNGIDTKQFVNVFSLSNKILNKINRDEIKNYSESRKAKIIGYFILTNLKVKYDPDFYAREDRSAQEVAESKIAKCTEFVYLFLAITRHFGLKTHMILVSQGFQGYDAFHAAAILISNKENVIIDLSAYDYYKKFYNIKHKKYDILNDIEMLAFFYANIAQTLSLNSNYQESLLNYKIAIKLKNHEPRFYANLGRLYFQLHNITESENYLLKAIDYYSKDKNLFLSDYINSHIDITTIYLHHNIDYEKAFNNLFKAYKIITRYDRSIFTINKPNYSALYNKSQLLINKLENKDKKRILEKIIKFAKQELTQ